MVKVIAAWKESKLQSDTKAEVDALAIGKVKGMVNQCCTCPQTGKQ